MRKTTRIFIYLLLISNIGFAQLSMVINSTNNNHCNGIPCSYQGPKVLINEIMINPRDNNGSIYGEVGTSTDEGEWLELYNPDSCSSVDVSCYILGNYVLNDPFDHGSSFTLPINSIIPPNGFAIIRGQNAPNVPPNLLTENGGNCLEIVVNDLNLICLNGGNRIWLANNGGWIAIYDEFGVPQDAVSWSDTTNIGLNNAPCINNLANCNDITYLSSYNQISTNRKTYISQNAQTISSTMALRRVPDGNTWDIGNFANPTYGTRNINCSSNSINFCNGLAEVIPQGGTPPYIYQWDDNRRQNNRIAHGLCEGIYNVTVFDSQHQQTTGSVVIHNNKPEVSLQLNFQEACINEPAININYGIPNGGSYFGDGVINSFFKPDIAGLGVHAIEYNYTNSFGCSNVASDNIIVLDTQLLTFADLNNFCIEKMPFLLDIAFPSGGNYFGEGINNNIFSPKEVGVGNYDVTYQYINSQNCKSKIKIPISIFGIPQFKQAKEYSLCNNNLIEVDFDDDLFSFLWSTGSTDNKISVDEAGDYWVKVSRDECSAIDTFKVADCSKIWIPTAFTPNSDGLNDYFNVVLEEVPFYEIYIYSRWGEVIFHSIDVKEGWDGRYKQNNCQQGLYNYNISVSFDNKIKKHYTGSIMLMR